ncbi:MAG: type IV pilin protein [Pseudomonadota bacterium]
MKHTAANRMHGKTRVKGFTLIEFMITVAIVAIIATIAYPSYQDQMRKSRRADAQGALVSAANAMERYFTTNNTYATATLGAGGVYPSQTPLDGATKFYNLSFSVLTASTFTLRATPIAGSAQASDGMLELTSAGAKRWDRDNSGGFGANENTWNR